MIASVSNKFEKQMQSTCAQMATVIRARRGRRRNEGMCEEVCGFVIFSYNAYFCDT